MEAVCEWVGVVCEWDMVCRRMDLCVDDRVIGWWICDGVN